MKYSLTNVIDNIADFIRGHKANSTGNAVRRHKANSTGNAVRGNKTKSMDGVVWRHEVKYELSFVEADSIRKRLSGESSFRSIPSGHNAVSPVRRGVARRDPFADTSGTYRVCSLYFDDPRDTALRMNIEGVDPREKFRIRFYNGDMSMIRLEKKIRQNGMCRKIEQTISPEQVRALIRNDRAWIYQSGEHRGRDDSLMMELCGKMLTQGLRPKTIVEYVREPFVYGPGNVRVTLDSCLRMSARPTDFLNPDRVMFPVCAGVTVLEVKWDAYLPGVIHDVIGLSSPPDRFSGVCSPGRTPTAFSKYARSRIFF